jgi:hypothetical protein
MLSGNALGKETDKRVRWWSLYRVLVRRALGKKGTPGHRHSLFAECFVAFALGKEATFVECLLMLSGKKLIKGSAGDLFTEC